jgi:hypothetical protein
LRRSDDQPEKRRKAQAKREARLMI